MKRIAFVFVTGASWLDSLVTTVTKSSWSHVALCFEEDDILVESLAGRGLILQSGKKYDGWNPSLIVQKEISEMDYATMLNLCRQWAEKRTPYGYWTCLAIGLKELFGQRVGRLALRCFMPCKIESLVCSELMVKLWRIVASDFLTDHEARLVSPDELLKALNEKSITSKIDKP